MYPPPPATNSEVDETKELEALMAVTNQSAASMTSTTGGMNRPRDPRLAGQGMPPQFAKPPPKFNTFANRPNADPQVAITIFRSSSKPKHWLLNVFSVTAPNNALIQVAVIIIVIIRSIEVIVNRYLWVAKFFIKRAIVVQIIWRTTDRWLNRSTSSCLGND